MKRRDLLPLLPSVALLAATLLVARFLGGNIFVNLFAAALAGLASVALGYLFSDDCRRLILAQANRGRAVLGSLTTRAKPISPVNTNAQK